VSRTHSMHVLRSLFTDHATAEWLALPVAEARVRRRTVLKGAVVASAAVTAAPPAAAA
jgi:monoamine oxidase